VVFDISKAPLVGRTRASPRKPWTRGYSSTRRGIRGTWHSRIYGSLLFRLKSGMSRHILASRVQRHLRSSTSGMLPQPKTSMLSRDGSAPTSTTAGPRSTCNCTSTYLKTSDAVYQWTKLNWEMCSLQRAAAVGESDGVIVCGSWSMSRRDSTPAPPPPHQQWPINACETITSWLRWCLSCYCVAVSRAPRHADTNASVWNAFCAKMHSILSFLRNPKHDRTGPLPRSARCSPEQVQRAMAASTLNKREQLRERCVRRGEWTTLHAAG